MPVDATTIARLERQLDEARAQLLKEDGERYRIIMREISEAEKQRILDNLADRNERMLFGLEAPEEPRRKGAGQPARSGGDLVCDICGKSGLTRRGLALHRARVHKEEREGEKDAAA